jgi:hypothetical protein
MVARNFEIRNRKNAGIAQLDRFKRSSFERQPAVAKHRGERRLNPSPTASHSTRMYRKSLMMHLGRARVLSD